MKKRICCLLLALLMVAVVGVGNAECPKVMNTKLKLRDRVPYEVGGKTAMETFQAIASKEAYQSWMVNKDENYMYQKDVEVGCASHGEIRYYIGDGKVDKLVYILTSWDDTYHYETAESYYTQSYKSLVAKYGQPNWNPSSLAFEHDLYKIAKQFGSDKITHLDSWLLQYTDCALNVQLIGTDAKGRWQCVIAYDVLSLDELKSIMDNAKKHASDY